LPKNPKRLLPKYDPDTFGTPEDHIRNSFSVVRLMNVQHEDVVCRLFSHTFENKASTWYCNLAAGSITSWEAFQKAFLDKFGEKVSTIDLMVELFSLSLGLC
jgi:hypothetical protein